MPLVPFLRSTKVRQFCEPCCGDLSLVRHLESAGLVCVSATDIAEGQDAIDIPTFDSPVITNPPYERRRMHALIQHFLAAAPFAWLLLEADWIWTKQARPFLPHCSDIVTVGRVKWIEGSPASSLDNYAWLRFSREQRAGPVLHTEQQPVARTIACASCRQAFRPARSDARYCGDACRQRAHRGRLSVMLAVTETPSC